MFMVSFRVRRKYLAIFAALVLVAAIGTFGASRVMGSSVPTAGGAAQKPGKVTVKTNEQRAAFIASFGWEVTEEPVEVMEVVIPKEFDSVYEEYNSMQKTQGYDLKKHAGKRAIRYTYVITNYPDQPEDVRINLLVRDNKLIGGDVCSLLTDGFIHGFAMPAAGS